jgi:hypothetical protein
MCIATSMVPMTAATTVSASDPCPTAYAMTRSGVSFATLTSSFCRTGRS